MEIELVDERILQKDTEIALLKQEIINQQKEIYKLKIKNSKKERELVMVKENKTNQFNREKEETYEEMVVTDNENQISDKSKKKCPVKNCDGKGNTRSKSKNHRSIKSCPNVNNKNFETEVKEMEVSSLSENDEVENLKLKSYILEQNLIKRSNDIFFKEVKKLNIPNLNLNPK